MVKKVRFCDRVTSHEVESSGEYRAARDGRREIRDRERFRRKCEIFFSPARKSRGKALENIAISWVDWIAMRGMKISWEDFRAVDISRKCLIYGYVIHRTCTMEKGTHWCFASYRLWNGVSICRLAWETVQRMLLRKVWKFSIVRIIDDRKCFAKRVNERSRKISTCSLIMQVHWL